MVGESPLTQEDKLHFGLQIAQAMSCLADHGITHRALACKNILVFPNRTLKLGKLGRHVPLPDGGESDTTIASSRSQAVTGALRLGIGSDLLRWMVRILSILGGGEGRERGRESERADRESAHTERGNKERGRDRWRMSRMRRDKEREREKREHE